MLKVFRLLNAEVFILNRRCYIYYAPCRILQVTILNCFVLSGWVHGAWRETTPYWYSDTRTTCWEGLACFCRFYASRVWWYCWGLTCSSKKFPYNDEIYYEGFCVLFVWTVSLRVFLPLITVSCICKSSTLQEDGIRRSTVYGVRDCSGHDCGNPTSACFSCWGFNSHQQSVEPTWGIISDLFSSVSYSWIFLVYNIELRNYTCKGLKIWSALLCCQFGMMVD